MKHTIKVEYRASGVRVVPTKLDVRVGDDIEWACVTMAPRDVVIGLVFRGEASPFGGAVKQRLFQLLATPGAGIRTISGGNAVVLGDHKYDVLISDPARATALDDEDPWINVRP